MIYNGEASSLIASAYEVEAAEKFLLEEVGMQDISLSDIEGAIIELRNQEEQAEADYQGFA